ncbi:hypothetical protein SLEP1_g58035 [Rubroshorea leprosula]|uniref:Uncharacterized protein n=1 Tax=Rubroshorea leprosula TaxID=152421 RepID=A0AAV5MN07_9ROSI|nr:hypothetical protein SLEP1_g58035 [Rubroshorea leprosula]
MRIAAQGIGAKIEVFVFLADIIYHGLNGYIAAEEDDGGGAEKRCLLLDIGSKGRRRGRIYWKELG